MEASTDGQTELQLDDICWTRHAGQAGVFPHDLVGALRCRDMDDSIDGFESTEVCLE